MDSIEALAGIVAHIYTSVQQSWAVNSPLFFVGFDHNTEYIDLHFPAPPVFNFEDLISHSLHSLYHAGPGRQDWSVGSDVAEAEVLEPEPPEIAKQDGDDGTT